MIKATTLRTDLKLSFLGPQGSGKGTQATLLSQRRQYRVLEMGKMLRQKGEESSDSGRSIKSLVDRGALVPNEITIDILREYLDGLQPNQGFVIDGFPRDLDQAQRLEQMIKLDAVIVFKISDQEAVSRIANREICPDGHIFNSATNPPKSAGVCDLDGKQLIKRDDDNRGAVIKRLAIYHQETERVINYYERRNSARFINGEQSIEKIYQDLERTLRQL